MCHPDRDVSPSTRGISEHRYSVAVSDADLPVFAVSPAEEARGAVIVIHDVYGARPFYEDLCRRFAAEGYGAMLPDLFVRQGALSEETREAAFARSATFSYPRAIEDLRALISDFKADDEAKIGTVGFCMGGTLVMLLAAREPDVSAGVVYYGFPRNAQPTELRPYEPLQETAQVQSPLLGFWGDQDHGVGMENVEQLRAGLEAAGKSFDFTIYPGLPHGFLTFDESKPHVEESRDTWQKMLAFYRDHLG